MASAAARLALLLAAGVGAISVGDRVPEGITLDYGFPPDKVDLARRVAGKKVRHARVAGFWKTARQEREEQGGGREEVERGRES
eukprot:scaffold42957_cov31-Tisochrysis_lutea.AAC.1